MLVYHETFIQYFKDQSILKGLVNRQKNNLTHLVGPTIEVEVPPVTRCHMVWTIHGMGKMSQNLVLLRSDTTLPGMTADKRWDVYFPEY